MIDIRLDHNSGIPYYRQIMDQVKWGIASGDLRRGERLPTVRALATRLNVNLNTVSKAYRELELRHIVITHRGTGTFVRHPKKTDRSIRESDLRGVCAEFLDVAARYGFNIDEVLFQLGELRNL